MLVNGIAIQLQMVRSGVMLPISPTLADSHSLIVSCCSFLLLKYSSLFIVVINAVLALVPSLCDLSPYYGGGG